MGIYLLKAEIFVVLENQAVSQSGEVQLTDAIDSLNRTRSVCALEFKGKRHDGGNKLGMARSQY